jgi:hypothetical protein
MSSFICSYNLLRVEAMKIEVCSAEDYSRVASLFSPLEHLPPVSVRSSGLILEARYN